MISDLVPNPFVGRQVVAALLAGLKARGFDDAKIGRHAGTIIEELRKLDAERNRRAEGLFKDRVQAGQIQFRLRLDGDNWRMPHIMDTTLPANARQLVGQDGGGLRRNLFAPFYEGDLNGDEQNVAIMLDGEHGNHMVAPQRGDAARWLRASGLEARANLP
ncbi:MAG: hypothetical protein U1E48_15380 [Paracoccaceae bacterium]